MFITGYLTTGNDLTATKCTHYVYVPLATLKFYIFRQKLIDFFFFRLSRARRISENAFGILVHRFAIFKAPICSKQNNIIKFVMASVSLHNWLMSSSPNYPLDCPTKPAPGGLIQLDEQVDEENLQAADMRNQLRDFLANEGAVAWQEAMINNY